MSCKFTGQLIFISYIRECHHAQYFSSSNQHNVILIASNLTFELNEKKYVEYQERVNVQIQTVITICMHRMNLQTCLCIQLIMHYDAVYYDVERRFYSKMVKLVTKVH